MSYLLEALRKSERERQEKSPVPGLQTPSVEWESGDDTRSRSPWLMVAVIAICLNTLLLAVLVWRFGFAEAETATRTDAAANPPTNSAAAPATPSAAANRALAMPPVIVVQQPAAANPAVVVRELPANHRDAGRQPLSRSPSSGRTNASAQTASRPSGMRERGATNESVATSTESVPTDTASLPTVHALPLSVKQQLPILAMNSHIYASNPRDSFVMINGVSLNAGDHISGDLFLVAVVPEGAVLSVAGQRFLLPALASFTP